MSLDRTYLEARITATKAMIVAYEDAILALTLNPTLNYSLDTGNNKIVVTSQDVTLLTRTIGVLEQRLDAYCARLNGGQCIIRPGF